MQTMCEALDVDLTMFQSIKPGGPITQKQAYYRSKLILSNPYFNKINKDIFIGFPVINTLGGFCMGDITKDTEYWINEWDDHPNELGNKKIAEVILKHI